MKGLARNVWFPKNFLALFLPITFLFSFHLGAMQYVSCFIILCHIYITTNKERNGRIVAGGNLIPIQRLLSLYLDIYIRIDLKYKTDNKKTGNNIN